MENQIDRISEQQSKLVDITVGVQLQGVTKNANVQTTKVGLNIAANLDPIQIKNVPLRVITKNRRVNKKTNVDFITD